MTLNHHLCCQLLRSVCFSVTTKREKRQISDVVSGLSVHAGQRLESSEGDLAAAVDLAAAADARTN